MTILMIFVWIIAIGLIYIFIDVFLIPYVMSKYRWWRLERKLRQMAKKYPKESEKLNKIADLTKEINKEEKL